MSSAETAARLRPRGSNNLGTRQFNERVVLQAIRLHGALPKAEIARLTNLTAQTVQLIIARLEADGLVLKHAPLRGRIGQPSVPMALNPDGAFSIGIKIGRRSLDVLLVDFAAQVRERLTLDYQFPDPDSLFDEIRTRVQALRKTLGPKRAQLLHGVPQQLAAVETVDKERRKAPQRFESARVGKGLQRLRGRRSEDESTLLRRFRAAIEEIAHYGLFDYVLVNDDLDEATTQLISIFLAEECRRGRASRRAERLLAEGRGYGGMLPPKKP